jgi:hypothetical protein
MFVYRIALSASGIRLVVILKVRKFEFGMKWVANHLTNMFRTVRLGEVWYGMSGSRGGHHGEFQRDKLDLI